MAKKVAMIMLVCATVLIASAPLAQSEPGNVHTIVVRENGPPPTYAETWEITPRAEWTWHGHIVNNGLKWLKVDVTDVEAGDVLLSSEMYRFELYPEGWVDTESVTMFAGHTYSITATPNGVAGSKCTVWDVFSGVPEADFSVSVDGMNVAVDASASYDDPSGRIVSYEWTWGDGSVGTGKTATHTYELPETTTSLSLGTTTDSPPMPYLVYGYTKDVYGNTMPYCTVTVTNVRTAESLVVSSTVDGAYLCNIANMPGAYEDGDMIIVEAVNYASYSGSAVVYVDTSFPPYIQADVTLEWAPSPGSCNVKITLTVTDDDGMTSTVSRIVTLLYL